MARLGSWIESHPEGIYVRPADAWVDPSRPKPKALITHGHSDHARGGHGAVLATAETLAIMEVRCGPQNGQALAYDQRISTELRARGHHDPIYYHGAVERLNQLYESFGVELGELRPATGATKAAMAGHIVIAPPGALNDRWSRRLPDPVTAMASGWMRIRQRARQRNVELPLIISDHADWDELTMTIRELAPTEVWITHGREEALKHWCMTHQIKACDQ